MLNGHGRFDDTGVALPVTVLIFSTAPVVKSPVVATRTP